MYWRDVVTLKAVTEGRDADGFPKETITETTVFADVSSTKRSEFYAARQAGISLALTVKLRAADYDGQERLSYEGKEYKVERAYTEAREYYELIIDTEHMTVTLNGANIIDRVSDDSAFFKLQPGENDIIVEGGTTADVKILWKDRWL